MGFSDGSAPASGVSNRRLADWPLDVGSSTLDVGSSTLDVGSSTLDVGYSVPLPGGARGGYSVSNAPPFHFNSTSRSDQGCGQRLARRQRGRDGGEELARCRAGGIASFKTARYLRLPQMIEHMTTILKLKPERPRGAPCDDTGADGHKRAECEERIRELLSALEGGTCLRPGNTRNVPKAVIRETKTTPGSETSLRFLLTDRAGPIAEFGSWQDARKYMCDLQISGASIIRVEKKRSELETVPEQQTDSALEKRSALRRKWAAAAETLVRLPEPTQ